MSDSDPYIHPTAIVDCTQIGAGTRIWAFCNIQARAVIGRDCNIGDHCFVENNVIVGDRVTIKNGVSLWDGVIVEDDIFIGPNAVFTNDVYPRSKVHHETPARTVLRRGATIGANAVIIAGHTIGQYAFIGAGSVVTRDVPDFTLWLGNPARQVGFVCKCAERLDISASPNNNTEITCTCGMSYRVIDGSLILQTDGGEVGT